MKMNITAVYKKVKEGYIAWIEEIPGVNTQGATKKQTEQNLEEALQMILEALHPESVRFGTLRLNNPTLKQKNSFPF